MAQNRFYSSIAPPTTLASSVGSSGNPSVNSITGLPSSYPFTMLIDWGTATQEAISVTSAPTGTGPYTLPCTRGIDGTTGQAHNSGAIIVHGVSAQDYNEPQVHISLGTSGTGISQVHGLANGSAVVGTTDTQTLSNKTLAATTMTGDLTISNNDASNPILQVTNTHSAPTASIIRAIANAAADSTVGIRVSGDTVHRMQIDSNGKHQWGPGGSSAVDTNLYRNGVGVLQTDTGFVAATETVSSSQAAGALLKIQNTHSAPSAPNTQHVANAAADLVAGIQVNADTNFRQTTDSNGKIQWGSGSGATDTDLYRNASANLATDHTFGAVLGAQLGAAAPSFGSGTGGILGLTNATAAPSASSISGGLALFSQSGLLKYMNANGLVQIITGSQASGTVTLANSASETAIATITVPANDPITGATYFIQGFGIVSTTGTPTLTWKTRWGGTAGTSLATTTGITQGSGVTTLPFFFQVLVFFTDSTHCIASQNLGYFTAAGTVPTINYQQGTSTSAVTTNANEALIFSATWGTANASNTLTSWYSCERIS